MKQEEEYEEILNQVIDVLEGGDVALDFEEYSPSAATTIRIIASIAGNALDGIRAIRELNDAIQHLVDSYC